MGCGRIVEMLEEAEKLREVGNLKFKASDVTGAQSDYDAVLQLLDRSANEFQERMQACRLPTKLNMALCCLKVEPAEAESALHLCQAVLDVDPDNGKASFRKAKALLHLQEFEMAEAELERTCRIAPEDSAPRRELESLRQKIKGRDHEQETTATSASGEADIHDPCGDEHDGESVMVCDEDRFSQGSSELRPSGGQGLEAAGQAMLENMEAWRELDEDVERVRKATQQHGELWKEVDTCLAERDTWNNKLMELNREAVEDTSVETQMKYQRLRGNAATLKSKEYFAKKRKYEITHKRVLKLDKEVLQLLRKIRTIEQDPKFIIDPKKRLDDTLNEAVLQDDPSKVRTLLTSLRHPHTNRKVEEIIQKRPELSIKDLKHRIGEINAQKK